MDNYQYTTKGYYMEIIRSSIKGYKNQDISKLVAGQVDNVFHPNFVCKIQRIPKEDQTDSDVLTVMLVKPCRLNNNVLYSGDVIIGERKELEEYFLNATNLCGYTRRAIRTNSFNIQTEVLTIAPKLECPINGKLIYKGITINVKVSVGTREFDSIDDARKAIDMAIDILN